MPELDRLAWSVPHTGFIADALVAHGVKLQLGSSLHDPSDPMGKLFFNILATAEFEADLIRMRTREGLAVACAKGSLRGRKPKLSDRQQELRRMHETGDVRDQRSCRAVLDLTAHRPPHPWSTAGRTCCQGSLIDGGRLRV